MQHKISVLDTDTFGNFFVKKKPSFPCQWLEFKQTEDAQIVKRIQDSTIVIVNKVKLTKEVLKEAKKLQFIALAATGYNNIDIDYCRKNKILVSNISNYAFDSVPEHTFALILALRKNILGYQKAVQNGVWEEEEKFCFFLDVVHVLRKTRMGIIGSGNLGKKVAKIAKAFEMEVFFAMRKGQKAKEKKGYLSFDELIATSKVISIHCPLLPETKNLITKKELKKMPADCLLINTARGGIVSEKDLVEAIKKKQIAGAAMDVVSKEPPGFQHPYYSILHYPNFILTPHIAWAGVQTIKRAWEQVIENIENFVKGKPSRLVV